MTADVLWHYYWKNARWNAHREPRRRDVGQVALYRDPGRLPGLPRRQDGKERWHVEIADFDQQYFSTMAPWSLATIS